MNEKTCEKTYGFAGNLSDALPKASFIGFTSLPIEKTDAYARSVFGGNILICGIQRVGADKASVPARCESCVSNLAPKAAEQPKLDAEL